MRKVSAEKSILMTREYILVKLDVQGDIKKGISRGAHKLLTSMLNLLKIDLRVNGKNNY